MKTLINLSILVFVLALFGSCVNEHTKDNEIQIGERIFLDGMLEDGEWNDAQEYKVGESEYVNSKVMIKHDGANLLIAYANQNIQDTTYLIPEIFIDSEYNRGDEWQEDDYWFHVSAQDCYAKGKTEDYSKCRPDYLEWRASPNYPFGQNYERINAFEISIPFELINVNIGDTIGLCFSLKLYPHEVNLLYPKEANDNIPSSWKTFIIR